MSSDWHKDYPAAPDLSEAGLDDNHSLKKMLDLIGEKKRVIDFGCATGYFAQLLAKRGCTVTGVEINPEAAAVAEQYCDRVIAVDLDSVTLSDVVPQQAFDVAVFGDVLEHLRTPQKVLVETRSVLKPGGCVIASIPNIAHGAVRLALLKGRFEYKELGILDDTHLRFFTRSTIEELFERSGYFIDAIARTKLPIFSPSPLIPQIDRQEFDPKLVQQVEQAPEVETLQFILRAYPASEGGKYAALSEKHAQLLEQSRQTQTHLQQSQTQLQQTQAELEQVRVHCQETQVDLGRSQDQLHQTQGELSQSQDQLHQTQGELSQSQDQLHQTQLALQDAQATLNTLQLSRFWKLRTRLLWLKKLIQRK